MELGTCYSNGLDIEVERHPETNEVVGYEGNFLYIDRETINSIEDVAGFILDLLDEQKKGNLPYALLLLWDSSFLPLVVLLSIYSSLPLLYPFSYTCTL